MAEEKMSAEELNRLILETELETKRLLLGEAQQRNADFKDKEHKRRQANKQRMSELENMRKMHERTVKACRHRSGGNPTNILKGGRTALSFSIITRAIMPDGVTVLLQCSRCRMLLYPPSPLLKKENPKAYVIQLKEYNRLLEESRENGIEHAEMRGPTFFFTNEEGVPFVPERV